MCTYGDGAVFSEGHRGPHYVGIARVSATSYIGRCYKGHNLGVCSNCPRAETLAHVAVQVDVAAQVRLPSVPQCAVFGKDPSTIWRAFVWQRLTGRVGWLRARARATVGLAAAEPL